MTDAQLSALIDDIDDSLKSDESDLEEQLAKLEQLVKLLLHGKFSSEQAVFVCRVALPRMTSTVLKLRLPESMSASVAAYLTSVLEAAVLLVRKTDHWEIVETVRVILTDAQSYHFYSIMGPEVASVVGTSVAHTSAGGETGACATRMEQEGTDEERSSIDSGFDGSPSANERPEEERACENFSPSEDVSNNYIRNVEHFHAVGGFEALIARIAQAPLLNLTAVQMLIRPLLKVKEVLKKAVLQAHARKVESALTWYVSALSDEMLKLEDRKSMGELQKCLDVLFDHARLPDGALALDRLRLALALKCLRTPNLEKRLHGLSEIKEMIAQVLRKQEYLQSVEQVERDRAEREQRPHRGPAPALLLQMAQASPDLLVEWIEREKVVELIFGEALHDQLVRRCVEILGFLATQGKMNSRLLSLMWRASMDKHECVTQAIYGALIDLTPHLPLPLLDELYDYICSISYAEYTTHTLTLLRGFAIAGISSPHNPQQEHRWYGLHELWDLMSDSSPVSNELRQVAASILADLLTWTHCATQRQPMLLRCVVQLETGHSVPQTLRLVRAMLASFPIKARKKMDSVAAVLEKLDEQHGLLRVFFSEFLRYHEAAAGRLEELTAAVDTESAALASASPVSRRTASPAVPRSAGAARSSPRPADATIRAARAEHMEQLGHRINFLNFCVVSAALTLTQEQLDVLWDRCVVHSITAGERDLIFRWVEQVRTNSNSALDTDSTRYLFSRASELPAESLSPTAYACIEYLFRWINWREQRFSQQDHANVSVLDLPLHGIDTLWAAALCARDEAVGLRAVRFLVLLHHTLRLDTARAHQQQREFVRQCMSSLDDAAGRLRVLEEQLGGKPAPPCTPPNAASFPSAERVHPVELERRQLCLRAERCLTLLRLFVVELEKRSTPTDGAATSRRHGACVRGAPMTIQIMLVGGGGKDPRPTVGMHSNQTVGELRVRVWRELLDEVASPSPRALRLIACGRELKEDWRTLHELKLRAPCAVHVMRRPEPAENADPFGGPEMDMDETSSTGVPSTAGAQPSPGEEAPAPSEADAHSSIALLEGGSNFDTLFGLLTLHEERLSTRAWQLLMMLPTNRDMRSGLVELPARLPGELPDWPSLLHEGACAFKLLYSLQIVDALLQEGEATTSFVDALQTRESTPRAPAHWMDSFVSRGGLRHLLKLLTAPTDELLGAQRGCQGLTCLVLLLRIVGQFLLDGTVPAAVEDGGFCPDTARMLEPEPAWTCFSFLPLREGKVAALVEEVALADHLMELIEGVALNSTDSDTQYEPDGGDQPHSNAPLASPTGCLPRVESVVVFEKGLDVQIVHEALRLLVACARAPAHSATSALGVDNSPAVETSTLLRDNNRLRSWLKSLLLQCSVANVRAEACTALYALACVYPAASAQMADADRVSELPASSYGRIPRAPTVLSIIVREMLALLPPSEAETAHSQQFFELLHMLVAACPDCELKGMTAKELFDKILHLERAHPILERRDAPDDVDTELVGYLRLLLLLIKAHPDLKRVRVRHEGAAAPGTAVSDREWDTSLVGCLGEDVFRLPSAEEARNLGAHAPPKCKTHACRAAALDLLAELANGEPTNLAHLVDLQLAQHLARSPDRCSVARYSSTWHYAPSLQERSRCGYVGLKNLGATCYLNSLVQQLFMVPEFRAAVLALDIPPPGSAPQTPSEGAESSDAESGGSDVLYHLQLIFGYLQESEKRWCDTREFCASFRDFENMPISPSVQMDVDEFLNMLFDQLETGLSGTPRPKLLQSIFGGAFVNQIIDKTGQRLSERMEPFYVLSIEVKGKASVLDGLSQFVEGEPLEGDNKYKCENGTYVEATKRCCISALPPVLIVHLKRFEFDYDLMKKMKLYDHCEFPQLIDMAPYTVDYLEAEENLADSADSLATGDDGDCMYELAGVLVHTGTSDSGHYYSFIKERRVERPGSYPWLHFNDTLVEPFDARDIGKCCFGGVESVVQWDPDANKPVQRSQIKPHSAYMLFYERVDRKSAGGKPHAPAATASLPAVAPATPKDPEVLHDANRVLASAPSSRTPTVEPAKLCTNPVVQVKVPEHIKQEVWEENMNFLRDRYIVDALHFRFLRRLVAMTLDALPTNGVHDPADLPVPSPGCEDRGAMSMGALQLGCHFLVETLARAKDKSTLADWVRLLQEGLRNSPEACRWFLLQAVSAGWLRSLLLHCSVPEMRAAFAQLLLHAATILRPHELYLYPPEIAPPPAMARAGGAVSLPGTAGDGHLMTVEVGEDPGVAKTNAPSSEEVGGGVLTSPPKRARIESVPGNENALGPSPALADRQQPACICLLDSFIALVPEVPAHWRHVSKFFEVALALAHLGQEERAWMIRRRFVSHIVDAYLGDDSPFAPLDDEAPPEDGSSPARPRRGRMGDKFAPPPLEHMVTLLSLLARASLRHEPHATSPLSLEGTLLPMQLEEYELLSHPALLARLLKNGLNVLRLRELLEHLCYEAPRTSATVLHLILQGIDTMDSEQLGPYLSCFCHVVCIEDSEQQWRTDWAMQRMLHVVANNMRYKQATVSCLRALLGLCSTSPHTRKWMIQQRSLWVEAWLLGGLSMQVRCTAEHFVKAILTAEIQETTDSETSTPPDEPSAETSMSSLAGHVSALTASEREAEHATCGDAPVTAARNAGAPHPAVDAMYEHLVGLLGPVVQHDLRDQRPSSPNSQQPKQAEDVPLPRLAPYFRACSWCACHGSPAHAPTMELLLEAYMLQDACRYECDETKREMLGFWYDALRNSLDSTTRTTDAPPPPLVQAEPQTLVKAFRRLLDSFVSLRPNERFVEYNRSFLPLFYGLLRTMLACPEGDACLKVLVSHRNWEWAIRYVVVEHVDYVQLLHPAEQEPYSLARALRGLLRACASFSADWRLRTLTSALASHKLVANRANLLPLLAYCMAGEEEVATACERGAPAQLCACLDAYGVALFEKARWETLHPILALLAKCASWLRHSGANDVSGESRQQAALAAWDVAATRKPVLHVLFLLLRPSLGLPPQAGRPGPVPPPALQAACFDVASLLAAVDDFCSQAIADALLQNRSRLAAAGPLNAALGALERASAAGAASGRLAELEAVLEAAKLIGPLAGEAEGPPVEPMSLVSTPVHGSHELE